MYLTQPSKAIVTKAMVLAYVSAYLQIASYDFRNALLLKIIGTNATITYVRAFNAEIKKLKIKQVFA